MDLSESRVLAFVPKHNSHGKRDVTGAFLPEAKRFVAAAASGSVVTIDNHLTFARRRRAVLAELGKPEHSANLDAVAFFCHGWISGVQLGFGMRSVRQLAEGLGWVAASDFLVVPLYCCSTGDDPEDDPLSAAGTGDGSFADKLRDNLCAEPVAYNRVVAHSTVAHTTRNPMVLFFDGMGTPDGGVGGYAPVLPSSANWGAWKRGLRGATDLRFRFPFMTVGDIHAELGES